MRHINIQPFASLATSSADSAVDDTGRYLVHQLQSEQNRLLYKGIDSVLSQLHRNRDLSHINTRIEYFLDRLTQDEAFYLDVRSPEQMYAYLLEDCKELKLSFLEEQYLAPYAELLFQLVEIVKQKNYINITLAQRDGQEEELNKVLSDKLEELSKRIGYFSRQAMLYEAFLKENPRIAMDQEVFDLLGKDCQQALSEAERLERKTRDKLEKLTKSDTAEVLESIASEGKKSLSKSPAYGKDQDKNEDKSEAFIKKCLTSIAKQAMPDSNAEKIVAEWLGKAQDFSDPLYCISIKDGKIKNSAFKNLIRKYCHSLRVELIEKEQVTLKEIREMSLIEGFTAEKSIMLLLNALSKTGLPMNFEKLKKDFQKVDDFQDKEKLQKLISTIFRKMNVPENEEAAKEAIDFFVEKLYDATTHKAICYRISGILLNAINYTNKKIDKKKFNQIIVRETNIIAQRYSSVDIQEPNVLPEEVKIKKETQISVLKQTSTYEQESVIAHIRLHNIPSDAKNLEAQFRARLYTFYEGIQHILQKAIATEGHEIDSAILTEVDDFFEKITTNEIPNKKSFLELTREAARVAHGIILNEPRPLEGRKEKKGRKKAYKLLMHLSNQATWRRGRPALSHEVFKTSPVTIHYDFSTQDSFKRLFGAEEKTGELLELPENEQAIYAREIIRKLATALSVPHKNLDQIEKAILEGKSFEADAESRNIASVFMSACNDFASKNSPIERVKAVISHDGIQRFIMEGLSEKERLLLDETMESALQSAQVEAVIADKSPEDLYALLGSYHHNRLNKCLIEWFNHLTMSERRAVINHLVTLAAESRHNLEGSLSEESLLPESFKSEFLSFAKAFDGGSLRDQESANILKSLLKKGKLKKALSTIAEEFQETQQLLSPDLEIIPDEEEALKSKLVSLLSKQELLISNRAPTKYVEAIDVKIQAVNTSLELYAKQRQDELDALVLKANRAAEIVSQPLDSDNLSPEERAELEEEPKEDLDNISFSSIGSEDSREIGFDSFSLSSIDPSSDKSLENELEAEHEEISSPSSLGDSGLDSPYGFSTSKDTKIKTVYDFIQQIENNRSLNLTPSERKALKHAFLYYLGTRHFKIPVPPEEVQSDLSADSMIQVDSLKPEYEPDALSNSSEDELDTVSLSSIETVDSDKDDSDISLNDEEERLRDAFCIDFENRHLDNAISAPTKTKRTQIKAKDNLEYRKILSDNPENQPDWYRGLDSEQKAFLNNKVLNALLDTIKERTHSELGRLLYHHICSTYSKSMTVKLLNFYKQYFSGEKSFTGLYSRIDEVEKRNPFLKMSTEPVMLKKALVGLMSEIPLSQEETQLFHSKIANIKQEYDFEDRFKTSAIRNPFLNSPVLEITSEQAKEYLSVFMKEKRQPFWFQALNLIEKSHIRDIVKEATLMSRKVQLPKPIKGILTHDFISKSTLPDREKDILSENLLEINAAILKALEMNPDIDLTGPIKYGDLIDAIRKVPRDLFPEPISIEKEFIQQKLKQHPINDHEILSRIRDPEIFRKELSKIVAQQPTTVRHYPGMANAAFVSQVKYDYSGNPVSVRTGMRHGVLDPYEIKPPKNNAFDVANERIRLQMQNVKQLLTNMLKSEWRFQNTLRETTGEEPLSFERFMSFKYGIWEEDAQYNIPMMIQVLVAKLDTFLPDAKGENEQCEINKAVIEILSKQQSLSLSIDGHEVKIGTENFTDSYRPISSLKELSSPYNEWETSWKGPDGNPVKKTFGRHKIIAIGEKALNKIASTRDSPALNMQIKTSNINMLREALRRYKEVSEPSFGEKFFASPAAFGINIIRGGYRLFRKSVSTSDKWNENLERAALEELIISQSAGISTGSCKSGKDRKGIEQCYVRSLTDFFNTYGYLPDQKNERDRNNFSHIFDKNYVSNFEQTSSSYSAAGSQGLKNVGAVIPKPLHEAISTEANSHNSPQFLETQNILASLNKPSIKTKSKWPTWAKVSLGVVLSPIAISFAAALSVLGAPLGLIGNPSRQKYLDDQRKARIQRYEESKRYSSQTTIGNIDTSLFEVSAQSTELEALKQSIQPKQRERSTAIIRNDKAITAARDAARARHQQSDGESPIPQNGLQKLAQKPSQKK